jgi:protease IV
MFSRLPLLVLALLATGCAPSFLVTPVSSSTELREELVQRGDGHGKVLIVEIDGMILNGRSSGLLSSGENDTSLLAQQLDKAADDSSIKAVVLRINSPGGTVAASDTLYQEVLRFKKRTGRPVIAYGQDLMASGAYYTACAADRIMSQPTSLVGSIGVIFESFDISGTMGIVGVKANTIKSGPMKDMGSLFKPLTEDEKAVMQEMVNNFYARFKGLVGAARKLEGVKLDAVSDGRVFTGEKALAVGLVDRVGTLNDALDAAREMGQAPGAEAVMYKRPHGYSGSIYADTGVGGGAGAAQAINVQLPWAMPMPGVYYLWRP